MHVLRTKNLKIFFCGMGSAGVVAVDYDYQARCQHTQNAQDSQSGSKWKPNQIVSTLVGVAFPSAAGVIHLSQVGDIRSMSHYKREEPRETYTFRS